MIELETRYCICPCGKAFKVLKTSKQKLYARSHAEFKTGKIENFVGTSLKNKLFRQRNGYKRDHDGNFIDTKPQRSQSDSEPA